ncbi:MAG: hypothetical protein R2710_12915 [Acidimicrobiales bacterium]
MRSGITQLNVYAGLAGFYILRDDVDTGRHDNPLGLPAEQYELGYVVQDRMLRDNGELFYPAFPAIPPGPTSSPTKALPTMRCRSRRGSPSSSATSSWSTASSGRRPRSSPATTASGC